MSSTSCPRCWKHLDDCTCHQERAEQLGSGYSECGVLRERLKAAEKRNDDYVKEFDRLTSCIAAQSNHLGRIDKEAYERGVRDYFSHLTDYGYNVFDSADEALEALRKK